MSSYWVRISTYNQDLLKGLHNIPDFIGFQSCTDLGHFILKFMGDDVEKTLKSLEEFHKDVEILEVGTGSFAHEPILKSFSAKLSICTPGYREKDALVIDTSSSFGSGLHPTTELCIRLLEHLIEMEGNKIKDVFDLGTGSGILALCALKLGAQRVLASDILMAACKDAHLNVKLNGYESKILVVQDSYHVAKNEYFDLVFANLLKATLEKVIPEIPFLLKPRAFFIFSGVTTGQMDSFLSKIAVFETVKVLRCLDWAAALLRKLE